ncbi:hypothetical protein QZH41_003688 [Actinostola sp. cb2023]|nr:hypothetical protein QZH41_003688 [Actinostola sp. cb2023]
MQEETGDWEYGDNDRGGERMEGRIECISCLYHQLPASVGEAPTFGFSEDVASFFFKPQGDCFWRGKVSQVHKSDHDVREYTTWKTGESGNSMRSKFLCGSGKKKRPSLPDYPREPEPNKTLDMSNIVPPLPSDLSGPARATSDYATSPSPESGASSVSSNPRKFSDDFDPRMDDEHKLISRYAARLAANSRGQKPPSKSSSELSIDSNKEQRELIQTLENKNRLDNSQKQARQLSKTGGQPVTSSLTGVIEGGLGLVMSQSPY